MDVNAFFKRAMDIISSALGLIVLSPVLLVIAAAIKLHDGGSVFYRASRVGRYGAEFKLYKFRSMVANADKLGPAVTGAADKRITPIGRFLRKTKLDELPQLINVLTGDMSLVGPRPESPKYVAYYTDEQRHVLDVRPGITSPASVAYRHEEAMLRGDDWEQFYIDEVMPAKLAIDLAYVEKASILQDFRIIWKTFRALFENEAA
jgi:lipopolysaccharide/colanic/teichoic acid biosynthesis glycosyltransferase